MEWGGRLQAAESVQKGDHSRRRRQSGFILTAADSFQHTQNTSLARTDKRAARAARNTRYRYNQIGPLAVSYTHLRAHETA